MTRINIQQSQLSNQEYIALILNNTKRVLNNSNMKQYKEAIKEIKKYRSYLKSAYIKGEHQKGELHNDLGIKSI